MLVKLENPTLLSKVIDIISELVTDVRIKIDNSGFSITAMDPANVSMVKFILPKSSFSSFETGTEVLGVNLDNLKRILKRCSSGSSLILEKQENLLNIQIQDKIKRNFSLALIEIESEEKEIPNLEFSSIVELASSDLVDSIEDCLVVSDACSFVIKDGKFIIEARGLNSAMSEFSGDEARIQAENCKSRYSLEYLQKFVKASKLSDKTILRFAEDHPLRMDVKNDFLEISFLLAPRVETED
jgi:proliferating cell nuclear antigen PCNA